MACEKWIPAAKALVMHNPALLASAGKAQMCVGGSANLARGLTAVVRDAGRRGSSSSERPPDPGRR